MKDNLWGLPKFRKLDNILTYFFTENSHIINMKSNSKSVSKVFRNIAPRTTLLKTQKLNSYGKKRN